MFLNRRLKQTDIPKAEDFTVSDFEESQELEDGEVLVKTLYLSVDPVMKFRMIAMEIAALEPWKVGEACIGGGVGVVLASKFSGLSEQDIVECFDFQWKTTFKIDGKLLNKVRSFSRIQLSIVLLQSG